MKYNPGELEKLHEAMLKLLNEFDRICSNHKIEYIAFGGTLLGAIRHDGFIPWDDDIDVALKREDYNRFIKIAKKELSKEFFLQTFDVEPGMSTYQTKLRLNGTLFLEPYCKNSKMHKGIFLDIFPLDALPEDLKKCSRFCKVSYLLGQLYVAKCTPYTMCDSSSKKNKIRKVIRASLHLIMIPFPKKLLHNTLDRYIQRYNHYNYHKWSEPHCFGKDIFITNEELYPIVRHKFGNTSICIPKNYDGLLRRYYGDYMELPPVDKRCGHRPLKIRF